MSSETTIFPKAFMEHHNSISDEERLKLELAGFYLMKSLQHQSISIFKGDD